ncbi:MAG: hypothetical protein N2316_08945 [Spirochaetes bacterium]|nr:hypothetical protein [Spirochaetota bacterium]
MAFLPDHLLEAPMADEEIPQLDRVSDFWQSDELDRYLKQDVQR